LGLYVFGRGKAIKTIIRDTRAGGSCINHCALHFYNPYLPFGGINQSGIGKSHGYAGFQAFSNIRSVYQQVWPYSPLDWLHAPYSKAKQGLIDFTLRWL
jgi:aldehyde dehydrogenase (NAD+)